VRRRLKAFDDHVLDRRRQEPLNIAQQRRLGSGDE